MTAKTDHIVMKGDGATCLHCGDHQQLTVPQNMDSWIAVARAFERAHAKCAKPLPVTYDESVRRSLGRS